MFARRIRREILRVLLETQRRTRTIQSEQRVQTRIDKSRKNAEVPLRQEENDRTPSVVQMHLTID